MSNLPSYNSATAKLLSDSDESISMRNNNVTNHQQQQEAQSLKQQQQQQQYEEKQQQQQEQQQLLQQQQQQSQIPYHDPPYFIRNSRAFRHFKNPPQPHMCIKDHTDDGQELFINVMSWTKICMPHSETDPIPLYGGMRVTSGSPKSPPLMFAVMANPAILKHVGRKCSDVEEKYALVKLMCDFVEAMNPGLKLARDAEVLKDRDLSGELKDIWGAVQAKRLREKDSAPSYESYLASQNQVYIDFGPADAPPYQPEQEQQQQQQLALITNNKDLKNQSNSVLNVDEVDNNILQQTIDNHQNNINALDNNPQVLSNNRSTTNQSHKESQSTKALTIMTTATTTVTPATAITQPTTTTTTTPPAQIQASVVVPAQPQPPSNDTDSNKNDRQVTKKEKLSGFLPNSCHNIFPFIKTKSSGHDKNGAHKEKNESNQKDTHAHQQQHHTNNITRKILHSGKDNNKLIQNDTANLESEISKLDIGKMQ